MILTFKEADKFCNASSKSVKLYSNASKFDILPIEQMSKRKF